jgi:cytochrome b561
LTKAPSRFRNAVAIYIDVSLLIALLLLFSPRLTGLALHEWVGIALAVPLLVHLVLSWTWISGNTARLLKTATARARANYVLNWTLFALIVLEVTSGIAISHVALPYLGVPTINDRTWRALHNWTLNVTLLVIGFHIAMNWTALAAGVRRYLWRTSDTQDSSSQ